MTENANIEELKAPLLAALGAADLALATVNELITNLRDRAEETRTDTRSRVEESRARLTKLQEELPEQFTDLRERFTSDELRKAAEGYLDAATNRYNDLVERGEDAMWDARFACRCDRRATIAALPRPASSPTETISTLPLTS